MKIINSARIKLLNALGGQPKTKIATSGKNQQLFQERTRNIANLKRNETIYNQGGLVSEAIDCYPFFALANGWRLEGENTSLIDYTQDFLESFDFDTVLEQAFIDALVFGDSFQENVYTRGRELVEVMPRVPYYFNIVHDDTGGVTQYEQNISNGASDAVIQLNPNQIVHFQLKRLGGSVYGQSLISRAYDDIIRDTRIVESTTEAIKRHAYRKMQATIGRDGQIIDQQILNDISKQFQDLDAKHDFVTDSNTELKAIDSGTLGGVSENTTWSLVRVCAALGVPEELLGLRQGSTDATAVSRIDTFFRKLGWYQKKIERAYTLQVLDVFTQEPGAVKLVLNDASPRDETEKAKWISDLMRATPIDPFAVLPRLWVQEQFDIEEGAYEEAEEDFVEPVTDLVEPDDEELDENVDVDAKLPGEA